MGTGDDLFNEVLAAHRRIKEYVVRTPIVTNDDINRISGKEIYFKCENLQKTGAFKARGALNAVLKLQEEKPEFKGVVTHSSGNHGQALAWAAKLSRKSCVVVCPEGTPETKINLIKKHGARVVLCFPSPSARLETCNRIAEEEGLCIVPPYDDLSVIAGQGTIGVEFLEQVPDLDMILVPISGGGMTSGISIAAARIKPTTEVCAVEPVGKELQKSLEAGQRLWPEPPRFLDTIAEGIRIQPAGQVTFPLMCRYSSKRVFTVSDTEMISAMRWTWENLKLVIEVSSAPGVAVVLSNVLRDLPHRKIGVILCGGNCPVDKLLWA